MNIFKHTSLLFFIVYSLSTSLVAQTGFLQNWIPDKIGNQIIAIENHHYDFQMDENVTVHFKADYYDDTEMKVELLAVLTDGQCYSQPINQFIRSDRSTLIENRIINIDGYKLLISEYTDVNGQHFYTSQFAMVETGHVKFSLHNPWMNRWSGPDYRILNYFISAVDEEILIQLVTTMINKFDKNSELTQDGDLVLMPVLYIKQAKYQAGNINLIVNNPSDIRKDVQFNIQFRDSEFGDWQDADYEVNIKSGISDFLISDVYIYDAKVNVLVEGDTLDQVYLKDGQWTIENPQDAFLFNVLNEERELDGQTFTLEREAIAVARLYRDIDLTKELTSGGFSIDLSSFNAMYFLQEGIDELTISFLNGGDTLMTTYIEPITGLNSIVLNPSLLHQISHIRFNVKSHQLALPMRISNITFNKDYLISDVDELFTDKVKVFPNPCVDILNIEFENERPEEVSFLIFNHLGSVMEKGRIEEHRLQINTSSYNSGIYFLSYQMDERLITEKFIVQRK